MQPTPEEVEAFKATGLQRLNRLFVGVEARDCKGRGSGHMPVWVMPEDEYRTYGSPATAQDWQEALSQG